MFNQRGAVVGRAQVTDVMRPNIVTLPGWWASRIGGSSATPSRLDGVADLGGGPTLHDTCVEVEKTG